MRKFVHPCLWLVALLLVPISVSADEVLLRNGGRLTGKITHETVDEVVLTLSDGMRMTIQRSRIQSIERSEPAEEEGSGEPGVNPFPSAGTKPPRTAGGQPATGNGTSARASIPQPAGFYEHSAECAWSEDFNRHPMIMAAKTTPFRAYSFVRQSPLAVDLRDKRYADVIREHGHSGVLSVWEFEYAGMRELRYGDQVRFIGEITSPEDGRTELIRLKEGPTPVARRLAVFLVRRNDRIERYATTTVFAPRDFRQDELARLDEFPLNVRTYQDDYVPLASTWVRLSDTEFLEGLDLPFGDTLRARLMHCRFRLDWLALPPDERPPLDPDLLARNVLPPLAQPGRPAATDEMIRRRWGAAKEICARHNQLVEELRASLATIGVKPDRSYILERDRIGVLGAKGVSIETVRLSLPQETVDELLATR